MESENCIATFVSKSSCYRLYRYRRIIGIDFLWYHDFDIDSEVDVNDQCGIDNDSNRRLDRPCRPHEFWSIADPSFIFDTMKISDKAYHQISIAT